MQYCHTQHAPLHLLLHAIAITLLSSAWLARGVPPVAIMLAAVAFIMLLLGLMFASLTVRDEGENLAVRYGPLPLFCLRIRYADIASVQPARSSLVDGLGIHWAPGRGWTYNLWGFECVSLVVNGQTIRIGSNDVENLVAFLRGKLGE